jgi:hypothetical protein
MDVFLIQQNQSGKAELTQREKVTDLEETEI